MSGKIEVNIRLIIVVKNKNCQAYLCVFSVFPSSSLSCRFCVFNKLSFHFPRRLQHGLDLFSTAQEQPHFDLSELLLWESAEPHEAVLVLLKTNLGHVEDGEESEMRAY